MRLIWIALVVVMSTRTVAADVEVATPLRVALVAPVPEAREPALTAMNDYFRGEIYGGFTLIGMGVVGMGSGVLLYLAGDDREALRGASYPALTIGVAHTVAGLFVGAASAKRIRVFAADIDRDSHGWIQREEKRMKGVSRQFTVLKIIEGVGIAGGMTMAAIGAQQDRPLLTGIGISLAVELASTLVFDIIAARRAKRYRTALAGIAF